MNCTKRSRGKILKFQIYVYGFLLYWGAIKHSFNLLFKKNINVTSTPPLNFVPDLSCQYLFFIDTQKCRYSRGRYREVGRHTRKYIDTYRYIHTYIHTYMHSYIHTYIQSYINNNKKRKGKGGHSLKFVS